MAWCLDNRPICWAHSPPYNQRAEVPRSLGPVLCTRPCTSDTTHSQSCAFPLSALSPPQLCLCRRIEPRGSTQQERGARREELRSSRRRRLGCVSCLFLGLQLGIRILFVRSSLRSTAPDPDKRDYQFIGKQEAPSSKC